MASLVLASRVEAVRLYHRGATVQRRFEVPVGEEVAWPLVVEVPGLPLALRDETVRVRLASDAPADADVLATDVHVGLHVKTRAAALEVPALDELRELERRIERLEADQEALAGERTLLESIEVPDRPEPKEGEAPPPTPLGARLALEGFVAEAVDERIEQGRSLRRELEAAIERRDHLREQLARVDAARRVAADEVTKTVTARLRGQPGSATTLALVVEYFVDGARWAPQYQCRIARDGSRAAIQLRALVCQRTGEDWRGVALELSTADAQGWTELPRLASLRIGRAQPPLEQRPGFRPPPQGARSLFVDYDRGAGTAARLARPQLEALRRAAPDLGGLDVGELQSALVAQRQEDVETRRALFVPTVDTAVVNRASSKGRRAVEREEYDEDDMLAEEEPAPECGARYDYESTAAMPMAAPAASYAAPSPMPPPAPPGFAGPAGAAAPPPRQSRAAAKRSPAREGGRGGGQALAPSLDQSVPGFSALRLPAASDTAQRGRLVPVDLRAAYEASLARSGLELRELDVLALVEGAMATASSASQAALPAGAIDVRTVSGVFDYAYRADARVDVPSDGVFHSVPLGVREGGCELEYVVVPRVDPSVYRVAFIDNPLPSPLLPGSAELYVGDEYVLTTTLPTVAPRERFRLGLGVEQAIKCARNTRFRESRSGSAVVATSELCHTIAIELANNLPRAARVEVRERLPQPAPSAEVVVEEARVEPAWEAYDQSERGRVLLGGRRWRVELGPGERRALDAEYVVKIYAQNEIVGGNRREV